MQTRHEAEGNAEQRYYTGRRVNRCGRGMRKRYYIGRGLTDADAA